MRLPGRKASRMSSAPARRTRWTKAVPPRRGAWCRAKKDGTPRRSNHIATPSSRQCRPGAPLCAALPPTIQLTGAGTTGVSVSPTSLDFGLVQCNQAAKPYQTVTINNTGPATTYTPTLMAGSSSPYTLADAASGNPIAGGSPIALGSAASATLRVVPKAVVSPASTAADAFSDTLTISTMSAGDQPHIIGLHETAQGAVLTLTPTAFMESTQIVAFAQYTVTNSGNLAAPWTLAVVTTQGPANAYAISSTSGTVTPVTPENGQITFQPPPTPPPTQYLGTLTLSAAGATLCQDLPSPVPLSTIY